MQGDMRPYPTVVESATGSDESANYGEMPNSAELQASPPINPLRIPGPIPISPGGPIPALAEGSKPLAPQYAMMLKAQSDREAASELRKLDKAESKKAKSCCVLF